MSYIEDVVIPHYKGSSLRVLDINKKDLQRVLDSIECNDSKSFFKIAREEYGLNDSQITTLLSIMVKNIGKELVDRMPADIKPYMKAGTSLGKKIVGGFADIDPVKKLKNLKENEKQIYQLALSGSGEGAEVGVEGSASVDRKGDLYNVRVDGKLSAALAGQLGFDANGNGANLNGNGANLNGKLGVAGGAALEFNNLDQRSAEKIVGALRDMGATFAVGSMIGGPSQGGAVTHLTSHIPYNVKYVFDGKDLKNLAGNISSLELSGEGFAEASAKLGLNKKDFAKLEGKIGGTLKLTTKIDFPKDGGDPVLHIIETDSFKLGGTLKALGVASGAGFDASIKFDHAFTLPKDFDYKKLMSDPEGAFVELKQKAFKHTGSTEFQLSGEAVLQNIPENKKSAFTKVNGKLVYTQKYDEDVRGSIYEAIASYESGESIEDLVENLPSPIAQETKAIVCDSTGVDATLKISGYGGSGKVQSGVCMTTQFTNNTSRIPIKQ